MHTNEPTSNATLDAGTGEDKRLTNLLGAFAVALSDSIQQASAERTALRAPLPAALIQIGSFSGQSSERLSKNLALSQSATARVAQRLKNIGLLSIHPSDLDHRAIKLHLTEEGERQRLTALEARVEILGAIVTRLSDDEKAMLVSILERVFPLVVPDRCTADFACRFCDLECCPQECCPAEPESETWKANQRFL